LKENGKMICRFDINNINIHADYQTDILLRDEKFSASCDVMSKEAGSSKFGPIIFVPNVFVGTYSVSKENKTQFELPPDWYIS